MPARISRPDKIQLTKGNYVADVLFSSLSTPPWYYVVQRADSDRVIDLARFETQAQAREAALQTLDRLNEAVSEFNQHAVRRKSG
jgi:hypothetical protein